jgi:hypothetical protein
MCPTRDARLQTTDCCDEIEGTRAELLEALRCSETVLILLQEEVGRLGLNAKNVPPKVKAAIRKATLRPRGYSAEVGNLPAMPDFHPCHGAIFSRHATAVIPWS